MAFHPRYLRGTQDGVSSRSCALSTPTYSGRRPRALRCRNSGPKHRPHRLRKEKQRAFACDFSSPPSAREVCRGVAKGRLPLDDPARRERKGTAYPLARYRDVTNSLQGPDKRIPPSALSPVAALSVRESWRGYRPEDRNGGLAAEVLRPGNGSRSRAWSAKPQHGNSGKTKQQHCPSRRSTKTLQVYSGNAIACLLQRLDGAGMPACSSRKDRTDVFLNGDQRAPRLSCRSDH